MKYVLSPNSLKASGTDCGLPKTRSGRVYGAFNVTQHGVVATEFDFASELHAALDRSRGHEEEEDDLPLTLGSLPALDDFSDLGSPLTSISSSRCTSRSTSRSSSPDVPRKIPRTSYDPATKHPTTSAASFTPSDASSSPASSSYKRRKKRRARQKRKERIAAKKAKARAEGAQFRDAFTYKIRSSLSCKYQDIQVISCNVDASNLPHASSAYIGARQGARDGPVSLESLFRQGFRLIEWDGR